MNLKEHIEVCSFLHRRRKVVPDIAKLTKNNIENLRELASMLKHVPDDVFDMESFKSSCGTVGCAAGWAAKFGISTAGYEYESPLSPGLICFDFENYSMREFCGGSRAIWEYLFDSDWKYRENAVEQAIQRIERVLDAHRECKTH